jgi:hypothetical protein
LTKIITKSDDNVTGQPLRLCSVMGMAWMYGVEWFPPSIQRADTMRWTDSCVTCRSVNRASIDAPDSWHLCWGGEDNRKCKLHVDP